MYVMHEDAPVAVAHIEADPEVFRKLKALKTHILGQYVPYLFHTPEDLGHQSQLDLVKLKDRA